MIQRSSRGLRGDTAMDEPAGSKTIVITGVTRGLGRALVDEFAAAGHRVFGCGRSADIIEQLRRAPGAPHDFEILDVVEEGRVRSWAARILENYGPPDLLLNSAAQINRNTPLWELSAEEFDRIIDVNLKGVANVI